MKKLIYLMLLLCPVLMKGQVKFISEGKIEYERKINIQRQFDDEEMNSDWFKEFIKKQPAFHNTNFTLDFRGNETIYKISGDLVKLEMDWLMGPAKENTIFTDIGKHTRQSKKTVFEENFLVSDSTGKIEWKITDEKRTIAGLDCRKAVGKMCDSVYIVAFYTDEIPVSGGPESFDGLPGMILGIAIPRLSTTWFATKVQLTQPVEKDFEINSRGTTKINSDKLRSTLKMSLKNWGKYGERNTWWVLL
ncbi:MAG TPA: GLPGLI family protein [Flavitalea sp.]|nr:GLPGLI family protein [Flavitalea sp.]